MWPEFASSPKGKPYVSRVLAGLSLLRRLHCPVLENELENGKRPGRHFFPFLVLRLLTVSVTGVACGGG